MAYSNIPMPMLPGEALMRGVNTGSNLYSRIMNAKYNNSLHPSGDVANAMYIEELRNKYGDNDPRVLQTEKAHQMQLNSRQSLIDYRDILNQLSGHRNLSPLGKTVEEASGNSAIDLLNRNKNKDSDYHSKAENPNVLNLYNQKLNKEVTNTALANKIPLEENAHTTLESININDLANYSGLKGKINLAKDMIRASTGEAPESLIKYNKAVTGAQTFAKQYRQLMSDSIQPAAMEKIESLVNPTNWYTNSKVAVESFNQFKKIADIEMANFKKHGQAQGIMTYKDGKFQIISPDGKSLQNNTIPKNEQKNNVPKPLSQEDRELLAEHVPLLLKINPKYTAKNIRDTADKHNMSIGQVIDRLHAEV